MRAPARISASHRYKNVSTSHSQLSAMSSHWPATHYLLEGSTEFKSLIRKSWGLPSYFFTSSLVPWYLLSLLWCFAQRMWLCVSQHRKNCFTSAKCSYLWNVFTFSSTLWTHYCITLPLYMKAPIRKSASSCLLMTAPNMFSHIFGLLILMWPDSHENWWKNMDPLYGQKNLDLFYWTVWLND